MKLTVTKGQDQGRKYDFPSEEEVVLGREPGCDLRVMDSESSRFHARITSRDGMYFLRDLNSTNGTSLNGRTVFEALLADGDEILIGSTALAVSDIPARRERREAVIDATDHGSSVLISLDREEADILASAGQTTSPAELARENKLLRKTCEISNIVAAGADASTVLGLALAELQDALKADTASVLTWSEEQDDWIVHATSDKMNEAGTVKASHTIIQQALNEGKAIVSEDTLSDKRFDPSKSIMTQGISSAICCPLNLGGDSAGVLVVDRRNRRSAFESIDLRMAATAAGTIALFMAKQRYEEESRQKARLAVIGEVIAGLAHYTKNVITGLRFSVSSLQRAIDRGRFDTAATAAKSIQTQERRISELVLNMLTYAKDRKPSKAEVDLPRLVEEAIAPYREHAEERGVALEVDCHEDTPPVQADEQAIHRMFLNLFMNALDSFQGKPPEAERRLRVAVAPIENNGKGAQLLIRDTGCGIPKEKLDSIFTVFYSTKGSRGTGLGLAVSHKIVKEHDGEIFVDSEENEWTEFRIHLPAG